MLCEFRVELTLVNSITLHSDKWIAPSIEGGNRPSLLTFTALSGGLETSPLFTSNFIACPSSKVGSARCAEILWTADCKDPSPIAA